MQCNVSIANSKKINQLKKKYSPIKKWASRMKTERSWEYWALFMVKMWVMFVIL